MTNKRFPLPSSLRNWLSIWGAVLASVSFIIIVFLFLVSLVFSIGSSYLGIFIYIVLPVFLIIGLLMIPLGMLGNLSKLRSDKPENKILGRWRRSP